jgi:hypothetical protein
MSNTWYYSLLIPLHVYGDNTIGDILQVISTHGYSIRHLASNKITNITHGTSVRDQTHSLDVVLADLQAGRDLFDVWKGEHEINLHLDFDGANVARRIKNLRLPDKLYFGEVSVSVENALVKSEATDKFMVATDLQEIFADLCELLATPYGYSTDENMIEIFMDILSINEDVQDKRPPKVLFWLQYFTASYAAYLDQNMLLELGASIRKLPNGILVSFSDYPWNVDFVRLKRINDLWQQMATP